jgi:hypothetical protein
VKGEDATPNLSVRRRAVATRKLKGNFEILPRRFLEDVAADVTSNLMPRLADAEFETKSAETLLMLNTIGAQGHAAQKFSHGSKVMATRFADGSDKCEKINSEKLCCSFDLVVEINNL